jgi:anti-sigma factor RsiW
MTNFRDVEQLSAYLDGQLKDSEATKLESLLKTNPELISLLDELRQSRAILRQLPQRRAPRNFTLTPEMVGQRPPLPRTYPLFRFATAMATFLLLFSFAANYVAPRLSMIAGSPQAYGIGGGGGGGDAAEPEMAMEAAPTEEPLLEAPAAQPAEGLATEEPAEEPPEVESLVIPTATSSGEPDARVEPTPELAAKSEEQDQVLAGTEVADEPELPAPEEKDIPPSPGRFIPASWQIVLGVLIFANIAILFAMRKMAAAKWQNPK